MGSSTTTDRGAFIEFARGASVAGGSRPVIPLSVRLLEDQLTPVLAYRRLVALDERTLPSFLFESVEGGERQGRHSIMGAHPLVEIIAQRDGDRCLVRTIDHASESDVSSHVDDPFDVLRAHTDRLRLVRPARTNLPRCLLGGWVGFAAYDTVRWAEPEKLDPVHAPEDDRGLPDMHFAYYDGVVIFDHVDKVVHVVNLVEIPEGASDEELGAAYDDAMDAIEERIEELQTHSKPLESGRLDFDTSAPPAPMESNITKAQHASMVDRALEYIRDGDIFQVVLGQRFERRSKADPFDVYRALRAVNPSPYMVYLQASGCILVASSPEILCRVEHTDDGNGTRRVVTNRPLAGTSRRGETPEADAALEVKLLADPKERAEHVMLVDLGRNDVGKVSKEGSIELPQVMAVERYSHVMHISSTVTGELRAEMDPLDALRAALPVGTVSGAPKIRAMQIIDELEPHRRGPYGGGMGYISLEGDMDIALALRTMVVPLALREGETWVYHIQAAGGIVLDSQHDAEFQETVNKAAALARAIDAAERAFGTG